MIRATSDAIGALSALTAAVAEGDESLAVLQRMHRQVDEALRVAVSARRVRGQSWASVGAELGITRQCAHQRWGRAR